MDGWAFSTWELDCNTADELLFAPRNLLVNSTRAAVITSIWRERSHLWLLRWVHGFSLASSANLWILLLLCGDVEANPGPPSHHSSVGVTQKEQRTIKCCALNTRSIVNTSLDLQVYLQSNFLDVLAVSETFLSPDVLDGEFLGCDYEVHRRERDRHGGGVMLIVCNSIPSTRREGLETDCEVLWVELPLAPSNLLVGVFNPPKSDCCSLTYLRDSLATTPNSTPIMLLGTLIYHLLTGVVSPQYLLLTQEMLFLCDIVNDFNLQQLVHKPTRHQNILDLVLTNRVNVVHDVEVSACLPGSDHDAVHFTVNFHKPRTTNQKRWSYNFRKADFNTFNELLSRVPRDCCFMSESVNDCWICCKDILLPKLVTALTHDHLSGTLVLMHFVHPISSGFSAPEPNSLSPAQSFWSASLASPRRRILHSATYLYLLPMLPIQGPMVCTLSDYTIAQRGQTLLRPGKLLCWRTVGMVATCPNPCLPQWWLSSAWVSTNSSTTHASGYCVV